MDEIQDTKIINFFKKTASTLSLFIILIGVVTEIGWQFNIDTLRNFSHGTTFMNPLTALNFILVGLSIQTIGRTRLNKIIWLIKLAGLSIAFVGFLRLEAIFYGFDTQIDLLLFSSKLLGTRMAPNTALNFILIGTALFFLAKDKYYKLIQILCSLIFLNAISAILGYIYSVKNLYSFLGLTPMALNTATAFSIASLAIAFIKPNKGFLQILLSNRLGGKIGRILIPAIIFIPLILNKFIQWTIDLRFFSNEFGFALLDDILLTAILIGVTFWVSYYLNKVDSEREKAEIKSLQSEKQFKDLADFSPDCIKILDRDMKIVYMSPGGLREHNFKSLKEAIGWNFIDSVVDEQKEAVRKASRRCITEGETISLAVNHKPGTANREWCNLSITPIRDNGQITGILAISRDITKEREIDKAKTEFVSLASHQLRTPLSSINWYTEMLLSGDAGKLTAKQKEYFQEVYKGSNRMAELVSSLLNVSRLEMGTFMVEPKPTDVVTLAKDTVEQQKLDIKERSLTIKEVYDKNLPKMNVDPKLLSMIFQNLLSNAIKYTPEKGSIVFTIKKKGNQLVMSVADTGYGIPKKEQDKIFTKLFRADNVRDKDTDGTGLGLYIVKSIIDNSNGKIWFSSEENKGSTFYISLPLSGMKKKKGTKTLE